MANRPFKRVVVDTNYSVLTEQRVTVSWAMMPDFFAEGPWNFTLQRSLTASDDPASWEDIATTSDQPWLYDTRAINNIIHSPIYYRIKLVDGLGNVYISQAQEAKSYWNRYDWSVAKEIVRKENLLLRKKTGCQGYLLKRRYFGTPCPDCLDPVTHQPIDANCDTCFGTGFVGGYYPAFEFWATIDATKRMRRITQDKGLLTYVFDTLRCLAYPVVEQNDIWVNARTNTRYVIGGDITAVARLRGIDLVLSLTVTEIANNSIIYKVPTPWAG